MEGSVASNFESRLHQFVSADGTSYTWEERHEASMTLDEGEMENLRQSILAMPDSVIQNDISGNGIKIGIPVPLSNDKLNAFLQLILKVISMKETLKVDLTGHAADRLADDILNGPGHPEHRGWLSEADVFECVCTINQVDGARLTINKRTLTEPEIKFNSGLALEVVGTKPGGEQGTLALAIIESNRIRIITLL